MPDRSIPAILGRSLLMLLCVSLTGIQPVGAQQGEAGAAPVTSTSPVAITGKDLRSRTLYLGLIDNLRKSGQVHAALAHLDAFDRQFPRSEAAALMRGDCLVDLRDDAGAAAIFQRLTRGRAAAAAFAGLGRIEALNARWTQAATHYAHAVAAAPTRAAYLSDYGFVLLRAGRAADAVFRLRQAVELAPGDPQPRNNLILALAASGEQAAARRLLAGIGDPQQRAEVEAELARPQALPTPQAPSG